jgi:hypothetical protein
MAFSARSAKQQLNCNRGTVSSLLFMLSYYEQDNCSNELVLGHLPAGKNVSTEAGDIFEIRHQATTDEDSRLRRPNTCCSELQSV